MNRKTGRKKRYLPYLETLEPRLVLDDTSAGYLGINARFLLSNYTRFGHRFGHTLLGTNVQIAQVENGRPPGSTHLPLLRQGDTTTHPDVVPESLRFRDGPAPKDKYIDNHALGVAGVMIAKGPRHTGVAQLASLISSAVGKPGFWQQHYKLVSPSRAIRTRSRSPGRFSAVRSRARFTGDRP